MGYDTFHKFPLIDTYAFFNYCKQSCSEQETPFYTYSVRVLAFPSDGYLKLELVLHEIYGFYIFIYVVTLL